jgi:hypothetical protein
MKCVILTVLITLGIRKQTKDNGNREIKNKSAMTDIKENKYVKGFKRGG